jgi:hypothetical protein
MTPAARSPIFDLCSLEGMRRRRPGVLCDGTTGDPSLTAGSGGPATYAAEQARQLFRKEVIQPQVPLRLPCYDFTPVADLTVDGCLLDPKIEVSSPAPGQTNSHGVTGGVYKARERIHRGMLIHDY